MNRYYILFTLSFLLLFGFIKCGDVEKKAEQESPKVSTEQQVQRFPEEAYRHNNFGIAYLEQYNYSDAASEFAKSLSIAPKYADAQINLGIAKFNMGKYDQALLELEKALLLSPDHPNIYYVIGLIYKAHGDYQAAAGNFKKVVKHDPFDPFAHYNLGICLSRLGEIERAVEELEKVTSLDPNNSSAHYNLAMEFRRLNKTEDFKREMEIFTGLRKKGIATSVGLGYLEQGRYAEAVSRTETVSEELEDSSVEIRFTDVTYISGQESGVELTSPRRKGEDVLATGIRGSFGDYDNDGALDIFIFGRLYRNKADGQFEDVTEEAGLKDTESISKGIFGDYDNDEDQDLLVVSSGAVILYKNDGDGQFEDVTQSANLRRLQGSDALIPDPRPNRGPVFADYDHDGDLDIYVVNANGKNVLYRNNANGRFTDVTDEAKVPGGKWSTDCVFLDYDNDRDVDFCVASYDGSVNLYSNDRGGTFTDVAKESELSEVRKILGISAGDYDKDGYIDLLFTLEKGASLYRRSQESKRLFVLDPVSHTLSADAEPGSAYKLLDVDNDGDLDIVSLSSQGARLFKNQWGSRKTSRDCGFADPVPLSDNIAPAVSYQIASADFDNDGDIDLLVSYADTTKAGALLLRNEGGEKNGYLKVHLKGLNSNKDGIGAKVEIKAGGLSQKLELRGDRNGRTVHFGIGSRKKIDFVRILWPGGVRQTELDPAPDSLLLLEELDRKGTSCPIVYVWNGAEYQYITDILGGAIISYLISPGEYYYPDTDEYIKIPVPIPRPSRQQTVDSRQGTSPYPHKGGYYSIQFANHLEEVIYLDKVELLAVDHPQGTEVYLNERLLSSPPYPGFKVHALSDPRVPFKAYDQDGNDILPYIRHRDRKYPSNFELLSPQFHGYAKEHSIILELLPPKDEIGSASQLLTGSGFSPLAMTEARNVISSEAKQSRRQQTVGSRATGKVILVLYGYAEYSHSTSNLAAAQAGIALLPPRLEIMGADGRWKTISEDMGYPAGEPKEMVVEIIEDPRLNLSGIDRGSGTDYKIRITTSMPIYWDQILFDIIDDPIPTKVTRLSPVVSDLHWKGYASYYSPDGRMPKVYDYSKIKSSAPWMDHTGQYTRYGDCLPLLTEIDDKYVILFHGDEITLNFDASDFPPLDDGTVRDFFFYADGFGKDMDNNSPYSLTVEPLPFHSMSSYPYPEAESYPYDAEHLSYIYQYNTRVVNSKK